MAYYIAPGPKFRELELSEYAPALSTSICGIVGTATKGPINTATYITSADQFIQTFGQPNVNSYMAYAALEYLKRGKGLWVIRVCGGSYNGSPYTSAAKASIAVTGAASAATVQGTNAEYFTITAATGATTTGTEVENFILTGANNAYSFTVDSVTQSGTIATGTYTANTLAAALNAATTGLTFVDDGNGKIKITQNDTGASHNFSIDVIASSMYTTVGWTAATYTGVNGTDYLKVVLTGTGAGTQTFTLTAGTRSAAQVAEDINDTATNFTASADSLGKVKLVKSQTGSTEGLQVHSDSTADTTLGLDNTAHTGTDGASTTLTLYAASEGTWANSYKATISDGTASNTFKLDLYDANSVRLETFDNLSKDSSSTNFHTTRFANESYYITSVDVGAVSSLPVNGDYTLVAGADGMSDVTDADYIGTISDQTRTGLEIFANANDIDISILIVPGVTSEAVQTKMISVCEVDRRDCITILDTPYGLSVQNAVNFMNGEGIYSARASLSSSYACIYWPWVRIYDAYNPTVNSGNRWVPPSGFVAAQMAYTDYVADPWYPPAGTQRGRLISALEIEYNATEGDIELMYGFPNNLNPIIEKNGVIQLYGQKTLQRTATSKDRIGTRRMLLYAERTIMSALDEATWEPNDEITWRRVERVISPVMEAIKDRRGLTDYRVTCDATTNTSDLIAQNTVAAKVEMIHTKYSEIILVNFVSTPTGVSFNEV